MENTKSTMTNNPQIEFYFDPISPYVWLAATQLERIKQHTNLQIVLKPILFAGLLKAHEHKGPAEIPAKRIYTFTDVLRRATSYGLDVKGPAYHPFNPLLALRTSIAIKDDETRLKYAVLLLDAAWAKGEDITQVQTIQEIAKQCQLDPEWIVSCAQDVQIKQQLADATDQAIALGIFGVPTFRIDNQLFWGDDRINEMLRYIDGQHIDETILSDLLDRTSGAKNR